MEDPKIWDDAKRAQELGREKKSLENIVLVLEEVQAGLDDGRELFDMGKEDGDEETLLSVEADNAAAQAVYRSLGFRHWDTDVMFYRRTVRTTRRDVGRHG